MLTADANDYTALLLQPKCVIDATSAALKTHDRPLAVAQFGKFLEEAAASQLDLVVTPECSVPWDVLKKAITGQNAGPAKGKLWPLGCMPIAKTPGSGSSLARLGASSPMRST
jgi:hypothetical protein